MSDNSAIEWTDATWNPVTGCTRVSAGCDHCYIDRSPPFRMNGRRFDKPGPGGTTGLLLHPDRLDQPLRWRRPRKVFVNSLSDLFHDEVPNEYIARVFGVMGWAPRHTFQVLTKRPARMRALLADGGFRQEVLDLTVRYGAGYDRPAVDRGKPFDVWPLPNVWLGTSVEDQKAADLRIPKLLDTPAAVRFLSCEPLLGPVDLRRWTVHEPACAGSDEPPWCTCPPSPDLADPYFYKDRIDWVIAGGESGPGARPMHPDWPRGLRDQCAAAGVAFHFKQWGEYVTVGQMPPDTYAEWDLKHGGEVWPKDTQWRVGKHKAGRLLDGRTHDEYPEAIA